MLTHSWFFSARRTTTCAMVWRADGDKRKTQCIPAAKVRFDSTDVAEIAIDDTSIRATTLTEAAAPFDSASAPALGSGCLTS